MQDEPRVYTNDLYTYLYQSDKKTKDELAKFDKMSKDKEVIECTFKPVTNYSKQTQRERSINPSELREISEKLSKFQNTLSKSELLRRYEEEKAKREL